MKEEKVPHVVSRESGAHDVPVKQQGGGSTKGRHSGRAIPSKTKAGGDDFDHASNGGEVNAQNAKRS
jgi:hypothetical protein